MVLGWLWLRYTDHHHHDDPWTTLLREQFLAVIELDEVEDYLETYSLEEILELNDRTEAETLYFLVDKQFVNLPNPRPL